MNESSGRGESDRIFGGISDGDFVLPPQLLNRAADRTSFLQPKGYYRYPEFYVSTIMGQHQAAKQK